jgi:hypothetical protein
MTKWIFIFALCMGSLAWALTNQARGYIKTYRGYDFFAGLDQENKHVILGRDLFTQDQWDVLNGCTEMHSKYMAVVLFESSERQDPSDSSKMGSPGEIFTAQSVVCVRSRTFFSKWTQVFGNDSAL